MPGNGPTAPSERAGLRAWERALRASGSSYANARCRTYIGFFQFLAYVSSYFGDRSPSSRALGALGPRITWLDWHATVMALGQNAAECCYVMWKASNVVCRKQMRNDMDRELEEGAGDSATMGMCRVRNNMKSDNVMGSSPLDRLHGCTSSSAAKKWIVGDQRK